MYKISSTLYTCKYDDGFWVKLRGTQGRIELHKFRASVKGNKILA